MYFVRRRSGIYHEDIYTEDNEPQRRNRLSKQVTNPPSSNFTEAVRPHMIKRKSLNGASKPQVASSIPHGGTREAIRNHASAWDENSTVQHVTMKQSIVALMRNKFEDTSGGNVSATTSIPRRPLPNPLGTRDVPVKPSADTMEGLQRLAPSARGRESSSASAKSSQEVMVEDRFPPARKASFAPGTITRSHSPSRTTFEQSPQRLDGDAIESISSRDSDPAFLHSDVEQHRPHLQSSDPPPEAPIIAESFENEVEHDWKPPTPVNRPETPADLEHTHLGNLTLGSLRVTNHDRHSLVTTMEGRMSPALTDISRQLGHLKDQTSGRVRRDVSSLYPESEIMSEIGTIKSTRSGRLMELTAAHEAGRRDFSFSLGTEARYSLDPIQQLEVAQAINDVLARDEARQSRRASMDKMKKSEVRRSSLEKEKARRLEAGRAKARAQADSTTMMAYDYMSEIAMTPFDQESLKSPMGSVLRRASLRQPTERPALEEGVISKPIEVHVLEKLQPGLKYEHEDEPAELRPASQTERQDTPISFLSSAPVRTSQEDQFSSALEFQRSSSPVRQNGPAYVSERLLLPNTTSGAANSDSGYSSNTSLSMIQIPDGFAAVPYEKNQGNIEPRSPTKRSGKFGFGKSTDVKTSKPVLVKPALSKLLPPASIAQIESPSTATSLRSTASPNSFEAEISGARSTPVSPTKTSEGLRKRLQKKRRKSIAASELVVQRVASVEHFNVPAVSEQARSNLATRAIAVPELEHTYRSRNDATAQPTASQTGLSSSPVEMRFPSPLPEETESSRRRSFSRSRSKSRPSVESRPKSWFGWTSKVAKEEKKAAFEEQSSMSIHDLGSVADALGDNPYDAVYTKRIVPSRRPDLTSRKTSPHGISKFSRNRSEMDDTTAAEVSRARRKSISNHEISAASDPIIEDKTTSQRIEDVFISDEPHSYSPTLELDAPPLPPMPSQDEINKRLTARYGYTPETTPRKDEQGFISDPVIEDDSISIREERARDHVRNPEDDSVMGRSNLIGSEQILLVAPSHGTAGSRTKSTSPSPPQSSEKYGVLSEEPFDPELPPTPSHDAPALRHTSPLRLRSVSENYTILSDDSEVEQAELPAIPRGPIHSTNEHVHVDMSRPVYRQITSDSSYQDALSEPPPPPSHSPRPRSYREEPITDIPSSEQDLYRSNAGHAEEIAPPPPSHSPRPQDITPQPRRLSNDYRQVYANYKPEQPTEEPWATQASAWQARRAQAANIRSGSYNEQTNGPFPSASLEPDIPREEPLYPAIPRKPLPSRDQNQIQGGPQQYQTSQSYDLYNHPLPHPRPRHNQIPSQSYDSRNGRPQSRERAQYNGFYQQQGPSAREYQRRRSQSRPRSRSRPPEMYDHVTGLYIGDAFYEPPRRPGQQDYYVNNNQERYDQPPHRSPQYMSGHGYGYGPTPQQMPQVRQRSHSRPRSQSRPRSIHSGTSNRTYSSHASHHSFHSFQGQRQPQGYPPRSQPSYRIDQSNNSHLDSSYGPFYPDYRQQQGPYPSMQQGPYPAPQPQLQPVGLPRQAPSTEPAFHPSYPRSPHMTTPQRKQSYHSQITDPEMTSSPPIPQDTRYSGGYELHNPVSPNNAPDLIKRRSWTEEDQNVRSGDMRGYGVDLGDVPGRGTRAIYA